MVLLDCMDEEVLVDLPEDSFKVRSRVCDPGTLPTTATEPDLGVCDHQQVHVDLAGKVALEERETFGGRIVAQANKVDSIFLSGGAGRKKGVCLLQ
jgi:hypothetical protein